MGLLTDIRYALRSLARARGLATTVILKMHLNPADVEGTPSKPNRVGRPVVALVTLIPLIWLLSATMTASVQKIFHPKPSIGFLAKAEVLEKQLPALEMALSKVKESGDTEKTKAAEKAIKANRREYRNQIVDTICVAIFLALVSMIVLLSIREWLLLLARKKLATLRETTPVWLPDYAVVEGRPLHVMGMFALGFALLKELSGEAAMERNTAKVCSCHEVQTGDFGADNKVLQKEVYLKTTSERFNGDVRRCC